MKAALKTGDHVASQPCTVCGVEKPIDCFYLIRAGNYRKQCKPCVHQRQKKSKAKRYPEHLERDRRTDLVRGWRRQGIDPNFTLEDYDELVRIQGGKCAICQVESKSLCADHDHESSLVRGLLCKPCNTALGILKDDPALIASALIYKLNGGVKR